MKTLRYGILTLCLLALCIGGPIACTNQNNRLEVGGAYAPEGVQPDMAFYTVDAAYNLAFASIDGAFRFERDNRALLWKVTPSIKHELDKIRPQALEADKLYLKARAEYKLHPTPAGLDGLQQLLAKLQALAASATAVLPTK